MNEQIERNKISSAIICTFFAIILSKEIKRLHCWQCELKQQLWFHTHYLSHSLSFSMKNYYSNQRASSFEFIASVCKRVSVCAQLSNISQVAAILAITSCRESFDFIKWNEWENRRTYKALSRDILYICANCKIIIFNFLLLYFSFRSYFFVLVQM